MIIFLMIVFNKINTINIAMLSSQFLPLYTPFELSLLNTTQQIKLQYKYKQENVVILMMMN
jgi:hypothetical protein